MKVIVRGTNIDGALRLFKRKIKESNLLNTIKEKGFYEKPCQKRNRKKAAATLREKRRQEPKMS
tara:strand:- start:7 stop:198 length:192 start_codon:yes stop_codon:yes gene_type:complete